MHRRLEEYCRKVDSGLWALPRPRREEEMRELREHLAALTAAGEAEGGTDGDAARAALARFGPPQALGRQIARTWWRGRLHRGRDSPPAIAAIAGLLLCLPNILVHLLFPARTLSPGVVLMHMAPLPLTLLWCLLVGWYVGTKLSRRAMMTTLGAALSAAALAAALRPFVGWPVSPMVLPHLARLPLDTTTLGYLAQSLLSGGAFSALLVSPAVLAGRTWARRHSA